MSKSGILVGKWFHSFNDNGFVKWQGRIVSYEDPFYLVETFEWVMGGPDDQKLIKITDMADWVFYDDAEEMNMTYKIKYQPALREHFDNQAKERLNKRPRGHSTEAATKPKG